MNTEQIEKVIESIAKSGYTPERKTHIDKHISLDYGSCKFTLIGCWGDYSNQSLYSI